MNPTTDAKPKAKFSSRNLSAVFKAPLWTKPLPDNATGSLQRPNNRMLVLGRAAVAAPAPFNTPSLKRESQVHDVHVSLVPASSNWAESIEKQQIPETPETEPAPADVVATPEAPEKVWTPESVAEHLHTGNAPTRPKITVESSGRWGDDAVEQDIVQNNIRRQMEKEKEFPDLKEAAEDMQMHHDQGESGAADRSSSMDSQHSGQHHGRATGRWAHFNEQQEMHQFKEGNRWSRNHYGQDGDDRWLWDRREDDHWSRSHYDRHEDDRWSRGSRSWRNDDGGHERRPFGTINGTILPVPNDCHTHFSRSDARFDTLESGDGDRVLSRRPHRMDWSARRDRRSSSPSALKDSRFRSPQPDCPLTHSPAPDTAAVRTWGRAATALSKDEESSTPVAEAVESSSTESSSNASASSSPSPQIQLLKRPKMLFDPKTGSLVNAEDKAKRQGRDRHDRESATSRSTPAATASDRNLETNSDTATTKVKGVKAPADAVVDDTSTVNVIAVNSMQEVVVKGTAGASSVSSNAIVNQMPTKESNRKRNLKSATPKKFAQEETAYHEKVSRSATPRRGSRNSSANVRDSARSSNGKTNERGKQTMSTRNDRAGSSKPTRRRSGRKEEEAPVQPSTVTPQNIALLKQIAEGSSGGVVVLTDEQKGIEVSSEDGGFETVKSRRAVLNEKKRQRLASNEAAASASALVEEQRSKGGQAQENFNMASNSRVKAANTRRNADQTPKDRKPKTKQLKQAKSKQMPLKPAASAVKKQPVSPANPTEQVAGEAPTESTLSKKRTQYVKVVPVTEDKRKQNPRRDKQTHGLSSDRKMSSSSAEGNHRQHETSKRNVHKMPTRGPVGKAKPKQVRQVYVVKTPAPASSATSTAA